LPFTIKVFIVAILPANAKIGDQVSIIGSNLGNTQGNSTVSFNKANASDYQSWSDTLIKLTVPAGTNSGKLFVTVGSVRSNELSFTVIPYLSGINPTAEKIGNTVTFTGTGFNDTKGSSFVSFTGADVSEYQSWNNSQIVVKVPSGTRSGKVSVTSSGTKSNELDFSILPSITNIYPASGFVGDLVRISGISFGESRGSSTVSFNGADVTDINNSAVKYAARDGHLDVVKYLVEHGADVTDKNGMSMNVLQLAKYNKYNTQEMFDYLISHGATE
jgi:hypothetical protein